MSKDLGLSHVWAFFSQIDTMLIICCIILFLYIYTVTSYLCIVKCSIEAFYINKKRQIATQQT